MIGLPNDPALVHRAMQLRQAAQELEDFAVYFRQVMEWTATVMQEGLAAWDRLRTQWAGLPSV